MTSKIDKVPLANAILTGSQAYGDPRPDSDVDLVILVDKTTEKKLWELSEHERKVQLSNDNLVVTSDPERFGIWERGTDDLVAASKIAGPISREKAIDHFTKVGLPRDHRS